ncbi:MAG TPA: response regulator, partial [Ottowia sp.]|nr:response regulator [Ottowia sp.]
MADSRIDPMPAPAPRAVWIDLRCMPQPHGLYQDARPHGVMARITQLADIVGAIARWRPHFVCIDYDYPDGARLDAVPRVRREFPQLPVLMFTDYHTEALAVWALRHRVWDYRVKPVTVSTLRRLFEVL